MDGQNKTYHPHRMDRDMPARAEHLEVIRSQRYLTMAVCMGNQPYLAAVDYVYDEQANCFYFHTALAGRMQDYLAANPAVWGQIVEDRGYVVGQCTHAYRCVMFEARAELVTAPAERTAALAAMVDFYESAETAPAMKQKLLSSSGMNTTNIYRLRVSAMSGKKAP